MPVSRLYVTDVADPELDWHFEIMSVPSERCALLTGRSWGPESVRNPGEIREVCAALLGQRRDAVEFDAAPLLQDLRSGLAAAVAAAHGSESVQAWQRAHSTPGIDHEAPRFWEIAAQSPMTLAEARIVDHVVAAPIVPIERSMPTPSSLGGLIVEAGGGTATTLAVALGGEGSPWVALAFPAGMIVTAVARGVVGRVRGYFDRDVAARLRELQKMRDEGLIEARDYARFKTRVLEDNYGRGRDGGPVARRATKPPRA